MSRHQFTPEPTHGSPNLEYSFSVTSWPEARDNIDLHKGAGVDFAMQMVDETLQSGMTLRVWHFFTEA